VRGGFARIVGCGLFAAALAGCMLTDHEPPPGQPSFYRSLAQPGGELDPAAAQSMISGYRQNNGLTPVTIDPTLTRMALEQAKVAAENISAGYHTLAEAFSGWRDSPPHRANMLLNGATRMGIAAVYAPNSKYKVFWSLILAAPDEKRT
jgi:uncharacterized protein YkwD